jgi:hypothetical protein
MKQQNFSENVDFFNKNFDSIFRKKLCEFGQTEQEQLFFIHQRKNIFQPWITLFGYYDGQNNIFSDILF